MNEINLIPASLARRLAALIYDGLLMFAILVVASALTLPFTGGKGAEHYHPFLTVYFLAVIYFFNGWFWTHGGQTLGMRAWRIQILTRDGKMLGWRQAFIRFLFSLPFWSFLVFILALQSGKTNFQFDSVPVWLLYVIAVIWLIIDQWPDNWRDRAGKVRVRYFDRNKMPD